MSLRSSLFEVLERIEEEGLIEIVLINYSLSTHWLCIIRTFLNLYIDKCSYITII